MKKANRNLKAAKENWSGLDKKAKRKQREQARGRKWVAA